MGSDAWDWGWAGRWCFERKYLEWMEWKGREEEKGCGKGREAGVCGEAKGAGTGVLSKGAGEVRERGSVAVACVCAGVAGGGVGRGEWDIYFFLLFLSFLLLAGGGGGV